MSTATSQQSAIIQVRNWVESVVVGLDLCPFARSVLVDDRIRFAASDATSEEQLLMDLHDELKRLVEDNSVETTLLIHPGVLQEFDAYNQFLDFADSLLADMGMEGEYQIASFHPHYQFHDTDPDDVGNYTNRSPHPMLHLIREASLEKAIANYPNPELIPQRNIRRLEELGVKKIRALLSQCMGEHLD